MTSRERGASRPGTSSGTVWVTATGGSSVASAPERRDLVVGLVWAGDPRPYQPDANRIDSRRSTTLAMLRPLLATGGVRFVSFQLGEARAFALSGDTGNAVTAYKKFIGLWPNGDVSIPGLGEALRVTK